eukprot:m.293776 g.293776  ORF g.293776 m.293776 type:complete len:1421 (-) comp22961_c2_seq2:174-4436(-)
MNMLFALLLSGSLLAVVRAGHPIFAYNDDCLQSRGAVEGARVRTAICSDGSKENTLQSWEFTACGQLRLPEFDLCVDTTGSHMTNVMVHMVSCDCDNENQIFDIRDGKIHWRVHDDLCLDAKHNDAGATNLRMMGCFDTRTQLFESDAFYEEPEESGSSFTHPGPDVIMTSGSMQGCVRPIEAASGSRVKIYPCPSQPTAEFLWETTACGQLKYHKYDLCIDTTGDTDPGAEITVERCSCQNRNQILQLGENQHVQWKKTPDLCFSADTITTLSMNIRMALCKDVASQVFRSAMLGGTAAPQHTAYRETSEERELRMKRREEVRQKLLAEKERLQAELAAKFAAVTKKQQATFNPPSQREVVAYTELDFKGNSAPLQKNEKHMFSLLSSPSWFLDKAIMSVRVPMNHKVTLWSEPDCTGESAVLLGSVRNLGRLSFSKMAACAEVEEIDSRSEIKGMTVYENTNFGGKSLFLPAGNKPVFYEYDLHDFGFLSGISSARIPPGVRVVLYQGHFEDQPFAHSRHIPDFEHFDINDKILSIVVTQIPIEELEGVVLYENADFKGDGVFFGLGQHSTMYGLNGIASSLYIPRPGYMVMMYRNVGFSGQSWKASENITNFNDMPLHNNIPLNDNVRSVDVIAACKPLCGDHGNCIALNVCQCKDGFFGDHCQFAPPDNTSVVVCDKNILLRGEVVRCTLKAQRQGVAMVSSGNYFRMQALITGNLRGPITDPALRGDIAQDAFDFSFQPYAVVEQQRRLLEVAVGAEDAEGNWEWSTIHLPEMIVTDIPDNTTTITCDRTELLVGQMAHCTVEAARHDHPSMCSADAFVLQSPSRTLRLTPLEGHHPARLLNSEFHFNLTLLKTPAAGAVLLRAAVEIPGLYSIELAVPSLRVQDVHAADLFAQAKQMAFVHRFQEAEGLLSQELASPTLTPSAAASARSLRARLNILLGNFEKAKADAVALLGGKFELTPEQRSSLRQTREAAEKARLEEQRAMQALVSGNFREAVSYASLALEAAKDSEMLHLVRAAAALSLRNYAIVRFDTANVLRHNSNHPQAIFLLAQALFEIVGDLNTARRNLRICIKNNDIENRWTRKCADRLQLLNGIAEAYAAGRMYEANGELRLAAAAYEELIDLHNKSSFALESRQTLCMLYLQLKDAKLTALHCTIAVEQIDDQDPAQTATTVNLLLANVWANTELKRLKEALDCIVRAATLAPSNPEVQRIKEEVEDQVRRASRKDYYKILGVPRTASPKEIKSAYRKLVRKSHPDKSDAEDAEAIFMDIVEAYEVLMEEELRQRYDRGEDVSKHAQDKANDNSNFHNFKFNFNPNNVKDDKVRAWFTNPETGEKEWVDLDLSQLKTTDKDGRPLLPPHCCLPERSAQEQQQKKQQQQQQEQQQKQQQKQQEQQQKQQGKKKQQKQEKRNRK